MKRKIITRINIVDENIYQVFHPGHKLIGKQRYQRLYHYTSYDKFLKIFNCKRLKFGEVVNMNDIIEANKRMHSKNMCQMPLLFALKEALMSYKQISFTMDYDSLIKGCMSNSMWYHYGNKGNGVCIEVDFEKLKMLMPQKAKSGVVSYKYLMKDSILLPSSAKTISDVEAFVKQNIRKMFFYKTNEWKYENEYRIICQNEDYLNIEGAITAVYFTSCDCENVKATEEIVNGMFPVRYINYYSECDDITPIDDSTISMRTKYENIDANHKNEKTWMQQAEEFYKNNKSDKNKSLIMDHFI